MIAFVAPSGSGKTTLMEQVIAELTRRGYRVGAIKHGHHVADPDIPGKDSHRFRQAGAKSVIFSGPERWFMIQELGDTPPPPLPELVNSLVGQHDLVLVEGYRQEKIDQIRIHRPTQAEDTRPEERRQDHLPWSGSDQVVAVASSETEIPWAKPRLPLNDPSAVADFIVNHLNLRKPGSGHPSAP
ncbi:MAG: molybdopterin-guanine dinucleotide biosynthesis protein B [Magnetococcales bacterium]|nr:molybdopterin-guanine dinucleotide biosynthesis protein B [Magnetococcales bacterium]